MVMVQDRAICLRRFPFGESSLVVHVESERYGRVHLMAKGAYRPTSRYYAVLDLFHTLELEWNHDPRRELALLSRGDVLHSRRGITADLPAYRAALVMLELVEKAGASGLDERGLFGLLARGLDELESTTELAAVTSLRFQLGFLRELGLAPALVTCAACARAAPPVAPGRAAFSAGAGGRLCKPCSDEARHSGRRVGTLPLEVLEDAERLTHSQPYAGASPSIAAPSIRLSAVHEGFSDAQAVYATLAAAPSSSGARDDAPIGLGEPSIVGLSSPGATRHDPQRLLAVADFVERFLAYHLESRPPAWRGGTPDGALEAS